LSVPWRVALPRPPLKTIEAVTLVPLCVNVQTPLLASQVPAIPVEPPPDVPPVTQVAVPVADQLRLPPLARSAAVPLLIALPLTVPVYSVRTGRPPLLAGPVTMTSR